MKTYKTTKLIEILKTKYSIRSTIAKLIWLTDQFKGRGIDSQWSLISIIFENHTLANLQGDAIQPSRKILTEYIKMKREGEFKDLVPAAEEFMKNVDWEQFDRIGNEDL